MGMMNGKPTAGPYSASDRAQRDQHKQRLVAEFEHRRDMAKRTRCVWEGRFAEYVEATLRPRYHPDTFAQMRLSSGIQSHNNVLRDVLAKIAVAWSNGATWRLVGVDGQDYEDGDGAPGRFLAVARLDELAQRMDVLTELHPLVAVAPTVCEQERTGRRVFQWAVHSPETFNLVPAHDNWCEYVGIDIYGEMRGMAGEMRESKTAWTSDEITVMRRGAHGWDVVSSEENPYRAIPFVLFCGHDDVGTSLWPHCGGGMLADVTIEVNAAETFLTHVGGSQVKVLGGEFKAFPAGQVLRSGGVLDVGSAENVQLLDYQTDVVRYAQVYVSRLRAQTAVAYGLGADEFEQTGTPASGEALKMRAFARDRRALAKRPLLKSRMIELFWMAQHVLATQLRAPGAAPIAGIDRTVPYDPATFSTQGLTLVVDVNEIVYPELATEQAAREDRDLALGLTSRVELYKARNPDVDDVQAKRAVRENLTLEALLSDAGTLRRTAGAVFRPALGAGAPAREEKP